MGRAGLTGGIGAGKSAAARIFSDLGALVIDADELARQAVAPGSEGLEAIRASWPQVVNADGTLDRPALATLVFDDETARSALNEIVHPIVRRLAAEAEASAGPDQLIIHEVPLLFETGYAERCDKNVLVTAPRELRIARVTARSGWTPEEIERRMSAQIDPDEARKRADYVIENDGSFDDLRGQVRTIYELLSADVN
ncbi:MAG: dephospho-CoA kinase [Candidatus Eremiobacteraeota bacterium]|nr:dephospho-CoA kinase [Candidatus Eremiobacteraeota bacterium]